MIVREGSPGEEVKLKLCDSKSCLCALEVVRTMRYTNRRILYFALRGKDL